MRVTASIPTSYGRRRAAAPSPMRQVWLTTDELNRLIRLIQLDAYNIERDGYRKVADRLHTRVADLREALR